MASRPLNPKASEAELKAITMIQDQLCSDQTARVRSGWMEESARRVLNDDRRRSLGIIGTSSPSPAERPIDRGFANAGLVIFMRVSLRRRFANAQAAVLYSHASSRPVRISAGSHRPLDMNVPRNPSWSRCVRCQFRCQLFGRVIQPSVGPSRLHKASSRPHATRAPTTRIRAGAYEALGKRATGIPLTIRSSSSVVISSSVFILWV
jgi:hypothetical protein